MVYSLDLRQKAIDKLAKGQSLRQVAKDLEIHYTTLFKWTKRENLAPSKMTSHHRTIDEDALRADVEKYPDAYQYERAERLGCSQNGIRYRPKKCVFWGRYHKLFMQSCANRYRFALGC